MPMPNATGLMRSMSVPDVVLPAELVTRERRGISTDAMAPENSAPGAWKGLIGRLDSTAAALEAAMAQFASSEERVRGSVLKGEGVWPEALNRSGEDARNAALAVKQSVNARDDVVQKMKSSTEISEDQQQVIQEASDDMKVYYNLIENYTKFYEQLCTALAETAKDVVADGDNKVKVNVRDIVEKLTAVINAAKQMNVELPKGVSQSTIDTWKSELGDAVTIKTNPNDGTVSLGINTAQVESMLKAVTELPGAGSKDSGYSSELGMSTVAYQAWQTGRDTQRSNVQNSVQTLLQKFQNRQSNFDNLVKVLSNSMQSLFDTDKKYFQF